MTVKDYIPLVQTMLWILLVLVIVFVPWSDIARLRKALLSRLAAGSSLKVGPVEIGELRKEVQEVKSDAGELREQVSRLFLVTMAPAMFDNLKKLASGDFGGYVLSTGLRRELYHLRDIGYIELESIQRLPRQGSNLSSYVTVTPTGKEFVKLRESIDRSRR